MAGTTNYLEGAGAEAATGAAVFGLLLKSHAALERIGDVLKREKPRLPECIRDVERPAEPTPEPAGETEPPSPAPPKVDLAPRFCLPCGSLRLDWLGNGWKCQECGSIEYPAHVLCCWCGRELSPETILEHRRACAQLRHSADVLHTIWRDERESARYLRPTDPDWELYRVRRVAREAA